MIMKNETKQNNFYKVSDLACCATLTLFGFPIERIEKVNPRKALFVFKRTSELNEVINKYWKRQLIVEPAAYFEQLSFIKARIYSEK